jgi:hypothetical protein
MKYRKLRIAWSAAWGVGCFLMIVFYVRSYTWLDELSYSDGKGTAFLVQSNSGSIFVGQATNWMSRAGWQRRTLGHAPRPAKLGLWMSYPEVRLYFPYWFLAPTAAMLATSPWAYRSRWRFSIRTLLIVTTVMAALLGGLVAFDRAMVAADRVNVKEAYMAGRISLDVARNYTDEDVDRWPKPYENSSPPAP